MAPFKTSFLFFGFLCPQCGGTMVGVIEDPVKLRASVEWAAALQSALPEGRGPPIPQA
ncbi:MAG: hypothetical protein HKM06_07770 [Spirochaetales bacterium]|nr:hypothetical protein [Spirochaetales bacterium]